MWAYFLKGPIWKNSQLVKHWSFEMAANPTYNPKVSVIDESGTRLKNQRSDSFKLDLSAQHLAKHT